MTTVTVINPTVEEAEEMLPMELRFAMMDAALDIVTNNACGGIEPEFTSIDEHTELTDEFADPFYLVSRKEQEMGAPLVFCTNQVKA